ncbi:MAG: hypothetical protein L6V85_06625 [Clostridiales bacterium]|nr:MAG: hypothetical protein L6V85_06625 [Clostridiales bacterium]
MPDGFINVLKPSFMTSSDVVVKVRGILKKTLRRKRSKSVISALWIRAERACFPLRSAKAQGCFRTPTKA